MSTSDLSPAQEQALRKRKRQRLMTRLVLLAVFLSGLVLAGVLYFETTALAPGRAALVLRGGTLTRVVTDAGRVYRVPLLDRVVLVDLRPQPLPTTRYTIAGSDAVRATFELRATWQVVDASAYWRTFAARRELVARQIETEIERALRTAIANTPVATSWGAPTREALAAALQADIAPALKRAGLQLGELRITSVQIQR
jgi:regulator of protease activity HflC (stomatin/prohibitin superfamily)